MQELSAELRVKVSRPEAIAKIVAVVKDSTTLDAAAKKLGVNLSTLTRWRREYADLDKAILVARHEQFIRERG